MELNHHRWTGLVCGSPNAELGCSSEDRNNRADTTTRDKAKVDMRELVARNCYRVVAVGSCLLLSRYDVKQELFPHDRKIHPLDVEVIRSR